MNTYGDSDKTVHLSSRVKILVGFLYLVRTGRTVSTFLTYCECANDVLRVRSVTY